MNHASINGRFLTQSLTGVQRYAREVVIAIDKELSSARAITNDHRVELLIPRNAKIELPLHAIKTRMVGTLTGHLWEQLELPIHARGTLLSLCNTGPILRRNQILAIHDTNTRDLPHSYTPAFRMLYRVLHPILGRTAATIATVSHYSAGQIANYGIADPHKIIVAPNGCDHAGNWAPSRPSNVIATSPPNTIVAIGSAAPHKNLALLTGLADQFAENNLRLAIVGMSNPGVFNKTGPATHHPAITYLGRLDDAALAEQLRTALCLAFPSWTEGFGLPPLEAMMLGCPVISSDRASLPEVCGSAALFAPPDDPAAWMASILQLRNDPAERQRMIRRGHDQATKYTWRSTARTYLTLLAKHATTAITGEQSLNSVQPRI